MPDVAVNRSADDPVIVVIAVASIAPEVSELMVNISAAVAFEADKVTA